MKDPVALSCISKLAQNAADNAVVNTSQSGMRDFDRIKETAEAPVTPAEVGNLPTPANPDPLPNTSLPVKFSTGYATTILSHPANGVDSQTSAVASDIPLLITPHDILSFPVITLPFVACVEHASVDNVPALTQSSGVSDKAFVTVAAVGDLNSLPENVVIQHAYRTY